jgi:hypothetical protein
MQNFSVPIWRARASTRLFVAKSERAVLSRLLFNEELVPTKKEGTNDKSDNEPNAKGKEADESIADIDEVPKVAKEDGDD